MFSKLSLFAAIVAPLASALILQAPDGATSGGQVTIKWTSEAGDPDTWSFELLNEVFHNSFAVANNVNPQPQQLSVLFPIVPVGTGYTMEAVNIGNISDVYATSAQFSIGGVSSSSLSSGATSATTPGLSVSPRSTTTTSPVSTVIGKPSGTTDSNPSSTSTSASIPTAAASSARRINFKIGGMAAAVLAIGGAAIFSL